LAIFSYSSTTTKNSNRKEGKKMSLGPGKIRSTTYGTKEDLERIIGRSSRLADWPSMIELKHFSKSETHQIMAVALFAHFDTGDKMNPDIEWRFIAKAHESWFKNFPDTLFGIEVLATHLSIEIPGRYRFGSERHSRFLAERDRLVRIGHHLQEAKSISEVLYLAIALIEEQVLKEGASMKMAPFKVPSLPKLVKQSLFNQAETLLIAKPAIGAHFGTRNTVERISEDSARAVRDAWFAEPTGNPKELHELLALVDTAVPRVYMQSKSVRRACFLSEVLELEKSLSHDQEAGKTLADLFYMAIALMEHEELYGKSMMKN